MKFISFLHIVVFAMFSLLSAFSHAVDTDSDGISDDIERLEGTNPYDGNDTPVDLTFGVTNTWSTSDNDTAQGSWKATNGSGLSAADLTKYKIHGTNLLDMWATGSFNGGYGHLNPDEDFIQVELSNANKIDGVYVWNYNGDTAQGAKVVEILTSDVSHVGPYESVGMFPLQEGGNTAQLLSFSPINASYLRVKVLADHGGNNVGLSEIRLKYADTDGNYIYDYDWTDSDADGVRDGIDHCNTLDNNLSQDNDGDGCDDANEDLDDDNDGSTDNAELVAGTNPNSATESIFDLAIRPEAAFTTSYLYSAGLFDRSGDYLIEDRWDNNWASFEQPVQYSSHNTLAEVEMWLSGNTDGGLGGPLNTTANQALVFDMGSVRTLNGVYVWNYNENGLTNRGVNQFEVLVSTDADPVTASYTSVGTFNLTQGGAGAQTIAFANHSARLVKFSINSNHGGDHVGLAEVRFRGLDADNNRVLDDIVLDSDLDGVVDGLDACFTRDASLSQDVDGDGCDSDEDSDDDGDGYSDADEGVCGSDPLSAASQPLDFDTDTDGLCDGVDTDDDNDGHSDSDEGVCGSDPLSAASQPSDFDTDTDGLCDGMDDDDDGDGYSDAVEVLEGTDPLSAGSVPMDMDGDFIPDSADLDIDGDACSNAAEGRLGSNPLDVNDIPLEIGIDAITTNGWYSKLVDGSDLSADLPVICATHTTSLYESEFATTVSLDLGEVRSIDGLFVWNDYDYSCDPDYGCDTPQIAGVKVFVSDGDNAGSFTEVAFVQLDRPTGDPDTVVFEPAQIINFAQNSSRYVRLEFMEYIFWEYNYYWVAASGVHVGEVRVKGADTDKNGVVDDVITDGDGDGVIDGLDSCVTADGGLTSDNDVDGCDDFDEDTDDDNDGVSDATELLEGTDPLSDSETPADLAITPASVISTSFYSPDDRSHAHLIDETGLSAAEFTRHRTHDMVYQGGMWLSGGDDGGLGGPYVPTITGQGVVFDLGSIQWIDGLYVWNYNEVNFAHRGTNLVEILVSTETDPLTAIFTSLGQFSLAMEGFNSQTIEFARQNIRLVKMVVVSNHGEGTYVGLSEVRARASDVDGDWIIDELDLDNDGDGVDDVNDSCVTADFNLSSDNDGDGCDDADEDLDDDNDGVEDGSDAFPLDPTETVDTDSDGVGDNSDAFPSDPAESADTDLDGVGDNADVFPNDPAETVDGDSDGVGDNSDVFPGDPAEWADSDSDGVGDNADAFPYDDAETLDSDGDGLGDNADPFPNDAGKPVYIDIASLNVSAGLQHSCLMSGDTINCWGHNDQGQTELVQEPLSPAELVSHYQHNCMLDDNGVTCWGKNSEGELNVPALTNPAQLGVGVHHSCALDDTGVVCWGHDGHGQSTPPVLSNPTQLAVGGFHTCALDDTGVLCWGYNGENQTTVPALTNPSMVAAGERHNCAVDDTGVVCWGKNNVGQSTPPELFNVQKFSMGANHSCALDNTGLNVYSVLCWGENGQGQSTAPELNHPTDVAAGGSHSCAVDDTGVVCWGLNDYSQANSIPVLVHRLIDSDADGTPDLYDAEPLIENIVADDSDGDGLTNDLELALGTDPDLADTDGDGVDDHVELTQWCTDATSQDTDGDGMNDDVDVEPDSNATCTMPLNGLFKGGSFNQGQ